MEQCIYMDICETYICIYMYIYGPMAWWLRRWIPNPGVLCSKPPGGSMVASVFHPSEVVKISTRDF